MLHHAGVAVYACALDSPQGDTKGTAIMASADDLLHFSRDDDAQMAAVISLAFHLLILINGSFLKILLRSSTAFIPLVRGLSSPAPQSVKRLRIILIEGISPF